MSCSLVWGVRFSAVEPVSPDFRDVQPDGDGLLPVVGIAQPGGDVPGGVVEKSAGGVEGVPDGFGFGQRVGGQKPFPHGVLKNLNINSGSSLGKLSTGEMLKYQLAFAAAYRPQVLLLDEPTANLDPVFRDDFLKILQEFVAEYDMTILMATHLDEDITKIADYIMDVEDGRYSLRECI